jgi:hypothetical protein
VVTPSPTSARRSLGPELPLPQEGLSEVADVEVSEPGDISNRQNACSRKKLMEGINTFKRQ